MSVAAAIVMLSSIGRGERGWLLRRARERGVDMRDELARARVPRARQRESATGFARDVQRAEARRTQIVVEHAYRVAADHVARTHYREGCDRNAAGKRLELHHAERVGPARKDEHVGRGQMRGKLAALQQ